jgi:hypothetical protein
VVLAFSRESDFMSGGWTLSVIQWPSPEFIRRNISVTTRPESANIGMDRGQIVKA